MPLRLPAHHRNRGHGIGSILRNLTAIVKPMFNSAKESIIPLAKKAGNELKNEGIAFLKDTGKDLLSGNDLKSSVKKNIRKSKKKVYRKLKKKIVGKRGLGKKRGTGKKKTGGKKKRGSGRGKKATGGGRKKNPTTKRKKKISSIFDAY